MGSQAEAIVAALLLGVRHKRNDLIVEVTANLQEPPDEGGTPVKTGWARANWIPSVSQPVTTAVGSVSDAASQAGIIEVTAYKGPDPVFVANNAPYIVSLNDGSSDQAPSGFVEAAIAKAEQTLQTADQQIDVSKAP